MKKSISLILLAFSITATTQAQNSAVFAKNTAAFKESVPYFKPSLMVDLRSDSNATLILRAESAEGLPINIQIMEKTGGLVFEQTLKQNQFGLKLRFDNSYDGIYEVIVQAGKDIWRKTVTLHTSEIITRDFSFGTE